jgi:hypothetical protein
MSFIFNNSIKYSNSPNIDAFGRLRVSNPLTLFDSSHRYGDNGLWSTSASTGGSVSFNSNQGLIDLNVNSTNGSEVIRETIKVFSYQPGKSLLILNTFVMNPPKLGLRQRVGYYGSQNGYYLELSGNTTSFVERSFVSGSIVNTTITQSNWNVDKLDGTGESGITLDLTKSQILFMDIEWLGVGTVRIGFIIDGNYYVCHKFNHANIITSTYITSATLPLRYEISNTSNTASSSQMKQICSSVISEGGYELRGSQQAVGTPITAARTLTTAGTYYPLVSLRLKTTRLDAVVISTALSLVGSSSGIYNWRLVSSGTTSGGSWVSAGTNSSVEYNLTATSYSGGRILASGYFVTTTQSSFSLNILKEALFTNQLERDGLSGTPFEFFIAVSAANGNETAFASLDWEEISR